MTTEGKRLMRRAMLFVLCALWTGMLSGAQGSAGNYDGTAKVFRLDGGNVTYAFGVNSRGELQQLYWGGRLATTDRIPGAVPKREAASFDSSYTTTPQEHAGWGAGLFVEQALKVSF